LGKLSEDALEKLNIIITETNDYSNINDNDNTTKHRVSFENISDNKKKRKEIDNNDNNNNNSNTKEKKKHKKN